MIPQGNAVKNITWTAVAMAAVAAISIIAVIFLIPNDQAELRSAVIMAVITLVGGMVSAKATAIAQGQQRIAESVTVVKKQTNGQLQRLLGQLVDLEHTVARLESNRDALAARTASEEPKPPLLVELVETEPTDGSV